MKRNIAIVAGGDTSEIVVSLRSAQGIYSFIDKEKYNLYIVEMEGRRWEVQLPEILQQAMAVRSITQQVQTYIFRAARSQQTLLQQAVPFTVKEL